MTARFPAMIGLIRTSIKQGSSSVTVPVNKLCIKFLTLLREKHIIYGFSFTSRQKKKAYPRVIIHFKYTDSHIPVLKDLNLYKNTSSNFINIKINKQFQILSANKLYIMTSPTGLIMTSLGDMAAKNKLSNRVKPQGILLAQLLI